MFALCAPSASVWRNTEERPGPNGWKSTATSAPGTGCPVAVVTRSLVVVPGRVSTEFYDAAVPDPTTRDRLKTTGIRELSPGDIAEAILYAVSAPTHVNIATIELQPVEQTFGGVNLDPIDWEASK